MHDRGHVHDVDQLCPAVNVVWPKGGFQDADYMAAFDLLLEPIIAEFDPDLVIVSAGYDAAEGVSY